MPLAATIELPDRYRVVRHIASGGMASVWEAEDLLLGRLVAVKVLGAQFAADPGARARFQREARTAAQVSNQAHVVTIYDIGEHADEAFIVMEHFAGGTVADRLRAARDAGRRVPRETALRWLREAAAGLDVAHAAGIVHRDVKPANLLLDAQDRLAVGDFGIARLADDTQMTMTGQVLGTAAYISPEQALGHPAQAASDRYALAVVAHELLTGSRPFAGGPPTAQARQHAEARPTPASQAAPGLPPALDTVLARALAKDPAQRPGTAAQLVAAIESALEAGPPVDSTQPFAVPVDPTRPLDPVASVERLDPDTPPGAGAAAGAASLGAAAPPGPAAPLDQAMPLGAAAAPGPVSPPDRAAPPGPTGRLRAPQPQQPSRPRRAVQLRPSPPPSGPGDSRPAAASFGDGSTGAVPAPAHRRVPWAPLVAALAVAAAVALVLVLAGGGDDPRSQSTERRTATQASSKGSSTPTTAAVAPQPPPPPPTQSEAANDTSPAALNDRGFALIKQGRYGEAVEPLRAAVTGYQGAGESGLPYAYAIFNLAVALNRSGNPAEAIPLLRERLKFGDQRKTVQAELEDAQAKAGGGASAPDQGAPPAPGAAAGNKPGKRKGKRDDG